MHIVELNYIEKSSVAGGVIAPGMAQLGGFIASFAATPLAFLIAGGGITEVAKKIDNYGSLGRMQKGRALMQALGYKKMVIASLIFGGCNILYSYIADKISGDSDQD